MTANPTLNLPPVVDPDMLAELLNSPADVRLLDVRTPGEFETSHIPSSYNVPLDTLAEHGPELRAVSRPVVLVCRSGQRARRAEAALRGGGMDNLHVLDGGMLAWESRGHSVSHGRHRWSLERQVRLVAGLLVLLGTVAAALFSPLFMIVPGFIGAGLAFAALTDTCAMGMLLSKLPYNRASCDVAGMVQAIKLGTPSTVR